jgi:hypothetical protein
LLNTALGTATALSQQQLEGDSPPLICNTVLPPNISISSNRDCEQLPAVLVERYSDTFDSLEAAEAHVRQHQREPASENL